MRVQLLTAAAAAALASPAFAAIDAPAGAYTLDKTHASVTWKVSHLGLSAYTARFTDFDAALELDPAEPANSSVTATINAASIVTDYPGDYKAGHADSGFETWDEDLARNAKWFNSDEFPEITFTSTGIEVDGENTGKMTGELTFLGVTQPVTLDVTFNGSLNPHPFAPISAVGFSATTTLDRTTFGMTNYAPNIGADVEILIEAEFHQPVDSGEAQ
ncbi:MAG: YceI family protein [Caulobacterales bacterium]|nr:YceI family protein [Caulobacterales bacterium]